MNKAERLFQLVTLLRSRRTAITADAIAAMMGVSVRTVYRDVQALSLSGVPIEGEAGVGFLIRPGHHLPPLMFTPDELQALIVGSRMVRSFTDRDLGRAAQQVKQKPLSGLTSTLRQSPVPGHSELIKLDWAVRVSIKKIKKAVPIIKLCKAYCGEFYPWRMLLYEHWNPAEGRCHQTAAVGIRRTGQRSCH